MRVGEQSSTTYLGGWDGPDLVVIGTHEDIGKTLTLHAENPLIEIGRLGGGNTSLHSSIDQTVNASDLLLLRQHGDVVLEGVRNPEALVADI
jgi:hypothetical protein